MGREEEEGGGGGEERGLVAMMPKYSLPASMDIGGRNGQAAAAAKCLFLMNY